MVEYSENSIELMFETFCEENLTESFRKTLADNEELKNICKFFYSGGVTDWMLNCLSGTLDDTLLQEEQKTNEKAESEMKANANENFTFFTNE